jgi:head-tail adaptor
MGNRSEAGMMLRRIIKSRKFCWLNSADLSGNNTGYRQILRTGWSVIQVAPQGDLLQTLAELFQAAVRVPLRGTTNEITANNSSKWINPLATWKNTKPPTHISNRINAITMNGPNLISSPPAYSIVVG